MIKQLSRRELKLALAVLTIAAAFGAFHFVYTPLLRLLNSLNQEIRTSESRLLKSLRITHQADRINAEYEKLAAVHQIKGTNEEMISSLLRSVESMARSAGITITDIKPRAGQEAENHRNYLIEMDTEVSMPSLFRFLQTLETSPELFTILKVNLYPKGRNSKVLRAYILVSRMVWI